eukprot:gene13681-16167_t
MTLPMRLSQEYKQAFGMKLVRNGHSARGAIMLGGQVPRFTLQAHVLLYPAQAVNPRGHSSHGGRSLRQGDTPHALHISQRSAPDAKVGRLRARRREEGAQPPPDANANKSSGESANFDDETLSALENVLGDASTDLKPDEQTYLTRATLEVAENAATAESVGGSGRGADWQTNLRALQQKLERQSTIGKLLSECIEPFGSSRGLLPDLVWLAGSDLDKPYLSEESRAGSEGNTGTAAPAEGSGLSGRADRLGSSRSVEQMALPVVTLPYALAPGELLTLELYEPRWLTLFAALLSEGQPRLLRSGERVVDLDSDDVAARAIEVYEIPEGKGQREAAAALAEDGPYSAVLSGHARVDEKLFLGSRRFGACLREGAEMDGRVATVGTVMDIEAVELKAGPGGAPVLTIIASGAARFRTVRITQQRPYFVLQAMMFDDDAEEADPVQESAARTMLLSALSEKLAEVRKGRELPRRPSQGTGRSRKGREVRVYDDEVVGLNSESRALDVLTLGVMMLRSRPYAAQALLESTSVAKRTLVIEQWLAYGKPQSASNIGLSVLAYTLPLIPVLALLALFVSNYVIF